VTLVRRGIVIFLASGAYLGFAPVASGTFGTLAGVAMYPVFDALRNLSLPLYLLTFFALVAAAVLIAGEAEEILGEADSGKITIDEIAGYVCATLFVRPSPAAVAASFLLFRFFDVAKLGAPRAGMARRVDRVATASDRTARFEIGIRSSALPPSGR
jgi:phosphatidylglycerophosphatase A